jgi:ribosomal protein S18 acetylase RimI-like enzyme
MCATVDCTHLKRVAAFPPRAMAPDEIKARSGTPEDLPAVARQYAHGDTPWDPFGDVTKLSRIPQDGLLVAEVNGEYAGFLYWFEGKRPYFDRNVDRYANFQELHVLERFRRRGLAKALIERFLADAGRRGIADAFVDTDEDNTIAQHLYERFGFTQYRTVLHYRVRLGGGTSPSASK